MLFRSILTVKGSVARVGVKNHDPQADMDVNGTIRATGGTFTSGTSGADSQSSAGIVLRRGKRILSGIPQNSNEDFYLRNLLEHTSSGNIVIGQAGTSLIGDMLLKPGASGNVIFYTINDGNESMRIDSSGNVGIGTNNPSQKLDVVGSIEVSNGIYVGGTAAANRLDDYEEGTYNLQFRLFKIGTTTSSITVTSSDFGYFDNDSTYTKVGNKVTLYIDLKYSNPTNSNWTTATTWYLGLHNLPFAVKNAGTTYAGAVGGTYDFFSSFHMDANTGNNFFMSKGGYSNYDNAIAFKSASNTINYGWRPLFSSEAPIFYSPSSGIVHLTGVITYSTDD